MSINPRLSSFGKALVLTIYLALASAPLGEGFAQEANQGVTVPPDNFSGIINPSQEVVQIRGKYWALIIGIDEYQHVPWLTTAVNDAKGVRDVLVQRYGFESSRITLLLNSQAIRSRIEGTLIKLGVETEPEDSVFIYYAGHGVYSPDQRLGWWVPVEGQRGEPGTYILDAAIRNYVATMRARHVYLVVDSCFSGTLFARRRAVPSQSLDKFFSRLYSKKSRWAFTSGSTEPVVDQGQAGHSTFAYHFINYLRENQNPYLVPSRIADRVIPLVANNSDQLPQSHALQGANDEGGQFVFQLASANLSFQKQQRDLEEKIGIQGIQELENRNKEIQRLLAKEREREEEFKNALEMERKKRRESEQKALELEHARKAFPDDSQERNAEKIPPFFGGF